MLCIAIGLPSVVGVVVAVAVVMFWVVKHSGVIMLLWVYKEHPEAENTIIMNNKEEQNIISPETGGVGGRSSPHKRTEEEMLNRTLTIGCVFVLDSVCFGLRLVVWYSFCFFYSLVYAIVWSVGWLLGCCCCWCCCNVLLLPKMFYVLPLSSGSPRLSFSRHNIMFSSFGLVSNTMIANVFEVTLAILVAMFGLNFSKVVQAWSVWVGCKSNIFWNFFVVQKDRLHEQHLLKPLFLVLASPKWPKNYHFQSHSDGHVKVIAESKFLAPKLTTNWTPE